MDNGSLHVITVTGGTIGRGDDSAICIPEDVVNEVDCKFVCILFILQRSYDFLVVFVM